MVTGSDRRVVCGGSWDYGQRDTCCAVHNRYISDNFDGGIGFRVVASVIPAEIATPDTALRVVRGGSWYRYQWVARCAVRSGLGLGDFRDGFGFRVVASAVSTKIATPYSAPRVLRGGSWYRSVEFASARVRSGSSPHNRDGLFGFRVAVSVESARPNSDILDIVVRGGSWFDHQWRTRLKLVPDRLFGSIGFRVVVSSSFLNSTQGENVMSQDLLSQIIDMIAQRVAERLAPVRPVSEVLFPIDLITVPAGEFLSGEGKKTVHLPEYQIGKYPVTNEQYAAFVKTGHQVPNHWKGGQMPVGKERHPVVNVSWHDANVFCAWLGRKLDREVRLPTEQEWEKAARGTDGREYPWGNEFDKTKANTWESGIGDTTSVDAYPEGVSPYGVWDMAGNVWEWTNDEWK